MDGCSLLYILSTQNHFLDIYCGCVRVYFTVMGVFTNCSVLVELKTLPTKEKRSLKAAITENGGTICFVVNKQVRGHHCACNHGWHGLWPLSLVSPQCSLVLTSDMSSLSSNRLRSIRKYQTPVVGLDFISSCLQRGALLPLDGHRLDTSPVPAPTTEGSRVCRSLRSLRLLPRGRFRNGRSRNGLFTCGIHGQNAGTQQVWSEVW